MFGAVAQPKPDRSWRTLFPAEGSRLSTSSDPNAAIPLEDAGEGSSKAGKNGTGVQSGWSFDGNLL